MERIGLEDRIMVNVLGSLFLFVAAFAVSQTILVAIVGCTEHHVFFRKIYRKVKFDTPTKSIVAVFFLETYIDLFLGGLINTENDYLFEVAANWGPYGYLSFSDQFTIILGNIIYIGSILFPFLVVYLLERKSRMAFSLKSDEAKFDETYECLYEDLATSNTGFLHYYFVFLMRRMIYCWVCFYFF